MLKTLTAAAAIAALAGPAAAQGCLSIDRTADVLAQDYGELPIGGGVPFAEDVYVAIYANPESGTWSLVEADPRTGKACIVRFGSDFSIARRLLGDPA